MRLFFKCELFVGSLKKETPRTDSRKVDVAKQQMISSIAITDHGNDGRWQFLESILARLVGVGGIFGAPPLSLHLLSHIPLCNETRPCLNL